MRSKKKYPLTYFLKGYGRQSILAPLFKLLEALFDLFVPLVVAEIIDVGIAQNDIPFILRCCVLLIALGVIGLVCSITAQWFAAEAAIACATSMRHTLFQHIQTLDFSQMDTLGGSTLITRLTSYAAYTDGDESGMAFGVGIDKVSREYTVIINTAKNAAGVPLGTSYTITVDEDADIFYVNEDGEISVSSYNGIAIDGNDLVYSDTRVDFVENKVVLAVPLENPGKINSFTDLASGDYLLCIGNDDVPVGAYSLEILDYLGYSLDQLEDQGKVTYASNVSEVARQVQEGVVDAGMVYATDASTYGLNVVDAATPEMCQQVIYPAAVMKSGEADSYDAAEDFLTYLYTNEEAISVWKDVGFTLIAQGEK